MTYFEWRGHKVAIQARGLAHPGVYDLFFAGALAGTITRTRTGRWETTAEPDGFFADKERVIDITFEAALTRERLIQAGYSADQLAKPGCRHTGRQGPLCLACHQERLGFAVCRHGRHLTQSCEACGTGVCGTCGCGPCSCPDDPMVPHYGHYMEGSLVPAGGRRPFQLVPPDLVVYPHLAGRAKVMGLGGGGSVDLETLQEYLAKGVWVRLDQEASDGLR